MFNYLNYQHARALQICIVFTSALVLQRILAFEHAGWIGFFVMVIYAGFDAGASIQRIFLRFSGTIFGLLLSLLLWFITQWYASLLPIVIAVVFYFAFFFASTTYTIPTIFTVTLTCLGVAYYSGTSYSPCDFFFDYFRCSIIALFICVFFEHFIFYKARISDKFYEQIQGESITALRQLLSCALIRPCRQAQFFKLSIQCDEKLIEFNNFLRALSFDPSYKSQALQPPTAERTQAHDSGIPNHLTETLPLFNDVIETINYYIHHIRFLPEKEAHALASTTTQLIEQVNQMHNAFKQRYTPDANVYRT